MEQGAGGWTEPEEQPFTTVSAAYVEPDFRKKSPGQQMYEEQLAACQGTNAPPREITVRERPFSLSPRDVKEWRKHETAVLRAIVDETRINPSMLNRMMTSFEEPGRRLATALLNTKPATEQEKWLIKSQEHLEVLERQRLHWLQLQLAGLKHPTEAKSSDPQLPRLYALARCMEWDESDASRAALDYFIPRSHSMTALKALGALSTPTSTPTSTTMVSRGKKRKGKKKKKKRENISPHLLSRSHSVSSLGSSHLSGGPSLSSLGRGRKRHQKSSVPPYVRDIAEFAEDQGRTFSKAGDEEIKVLDNKMRQGVGGFHTTLSNALSAATKWVEGGTLHEPEEDMVAKLQKLSPMIRSLKGQRQRRGGGRSRKIRRKRGRHSRRRKNRRYNNRSYKLKKGRGKHTRKGR
jgi:hypothetical protein